ncbi:MAG: hypothetical protein IJC51_02185 [Eggerthellaceae bacterium]|nr:hypothetical protein [Eggerthellaceae bacterium]
MAATKKTTATKKAVTPKKTAPVTEPVPEAKPEKTIMIPIDPGFESRDQMWEGNLNGKNILIKRGEWVTLPADLADYVMYKLWQREHVSAFVSDFKNQSKKLN